MVMQKLAQVNIGDAYNAPITAPGTGGTDPAVIISNLITAAFTVAGIIILFMFVGGGIGMISGAGNSSPESAAKARKSVTYAVMGFAVVFTAYWVVRLIEVITGSTFITNPNL